MITLGSWIGVYQDGFLLLEGRVAERELDEEGKSVLVVYDRDGRVHQVRPESVSITVVTPGPEETPEAQEPVAELDEPPVDPPDPPAGADVEAGSIR